ncbi:MAG: (Fe-S)-binding protein, partial [Desulfobacteraceae bacterium]|nr:(Fe-S)-binding protein [Desulfobacteraceae bacterium]
MNPLLMSILLIVGLGIFGRTMYYKIQLLLALGPLDISGRINNIGERLKNLVVLAVGQKRLIGRKKEWLSGVMHAFIFWGFCVLLIRSITLYGEGFVEGFKLPVFGHDGLIGYLYVALKDIFEGLVLIMALYAIFRRAVLKPSRMHNTWEAYFVLCMIVILMISDLLVDGARYNLITLFNNPDHLHFFNNPQYGSEFVWTPVSVGAACFIKGLSAEANALILTIMFWTHIITQLVFLNFLPIGKHFHVITALPNVFLKSLDYPHEKAEVLDLEDEAAWEDETLGINHIHQLNWKQGLDLYTCTECGR